MSVKGRPAQTWSMSVKGRPAQTWSMSVKDRTAKPWSMSVKDRTAKPWSMSVKGRPAKTWSMSVKDRTARTCSINVCEGQNSQDLVNVCERKDKQTVGSAAPAISAHKAVSARSETQKRRSVCVLQSTSTPPNPPMTDRSGEEGGVGCTRVVMATEHLYVQNRPVSPKSRGEYSCLLYTSDAALSLIHI